MNLLLDTHVLLWWLDDDPALSRAARAALADGENPVFVSSASVWEIRIKAALGKLEIPSEETYVYVAVLTGTARGVRSEQDRLVAGNPRPSEACIPASYVDSSFSIHALISLVRSRSEELSASSSNSGTEEGVGHRLRRP